MDSFLRSSDSGGMPIARTGRRILRPGPREGWVEQMTNRSLRQPRRSSAQLLARMLDEPSLVTTVQRLTPHALGKIIQHVGLEDCGEILSLATTEQLRRVFDEDLWRSDRPGRDEVFDAD